MGVLFRLTPAEVRAALDRMDGVYALMGRLLYDTGMRLMECVRLRVKDVGNDRNEILIRDGRGAKDRLTMLPTVLAGPLHEHLVRRRAIYQDTRTICATVGRKFGCRMRWRRSI